MARPRRGRSRENCAFRESTCEYLRTSFWKCGIPERDEQVVGKVPNAVSISEEVMESRTASRPRADRQFKRMCARGSYPLHRRGGTEMFGATMVGKQRPSPYATTTDFCQIFETDMNRLYRLSFLITGDEPTAEQCFLGGLQMAQEGNPIFNNWAEAWAR